MESNEFIRIPEIPPYEAEPDFHSSFSIQLGELIEWGWIDWSEQSWDWSAFAYDHATYERLTNAFNERFFDQEICITPPKVWKRKLLYKIKYELCPKYNPWYAQKAAGFNPFADSDEYGKKRVIDSSFPETLLSGNQDYASAGHDEEYENVAIKDYLGKVAMFSEYKEVDQMFLDDLQTMFASLWSLNANGL